MSDLRTPGWVRAAEIGLGALAIIIAIYLFVIPGAVLTTVIFIVGIVLLILGIESVISGLFVKSKSRMASIGLGILVIILSLIVIAFPTGVGVFLLILIGIVLLIDGISRLVHGFGDKERRGWSRGFRIGAGALEIVLGILIMVSPKFGATFLGIIIGIAVLIVGIEMVIAGIKGRRMRLPTSGR